MVVCIVSDGRMKINSRTLSVLAAMGIYQDGVAKNVGRSAPYTDVLGYTNVDLQSMVNLSRPTSTSTPPRVRRIFPARLSRL